MPFDERPAQAEVGVALGIGILNSLFQQKAQYCSARELSNNLSNSLRLHRKHRTETEVRVYDYVDREVPMLARMFEKRVIGYRSMGYEAGAVPEPNGTMDEDCIVEYDAEALRALEADGF